MLPARGNAQPRYLPASEFSNLNLRIPQAAQVRLEALQGSNSFERLANLAEASRYRIASRPVGRLKVKIRDAQGRLGTQLCTAALVAKDKLLTNYHCIPGLAGMTPLEARLELGYLVENDTAGVKAYGVDISPVEASEPLDYAIVRVRGNPGQEFGTVRVSRSAPYVRESLFLVHHPEGQPKTLSRKDCRVQVLRDDLIIHSCETLGGSSGSPIFDDNTMRLVGLHFAGSPEGNYGRGMAALVERSPILRSLAAATQAGDQGPAADAGSPANITLVSKPAGAAVFYQQVLLGVTPLKFQVARAREFQFELKKAGFQDQSITMVGETLSLSRSVELRAIAAKPPSDSKVPSMGGDFNPVRDQVMRARKAWEELDKEVSAAIDAMGDQSPPLGADNVQDVEQSLKDVSRRKPR